MWDTSATSVTNWASLLRSPTLLLLPPFILKIQLGIVETAILTWKTRCSSPVTDSSPPSSLSFKILSVGSLPTCPQELSLSWAGNTVQHSREWGWGRNSLSLGSGALGKVPTQGL